MLEKLLEVYGDMLVDTLGYEIEENIQNFPYREGKKI